MKRFLSVCIVLCLLAGLTPVYADTLNDEYNTIKTYYRQATGEYNTNTDEYKEGDVDPEIVQEKLQKLVNYYGLDENRRTRLDSYQDARLMYLYAEGRLAIMNGQYADAYAVLRKCGDFGYKITEYYSFAYGMSLAAGNESGYPEAISLLRSVQGNPEFTSLCLTTIQSCEEKFKVYTLNYAKRLCDEGAHDKAQDAYKQILELLPGDKEATAALSVCQTHTGEVDVISSITIKNDYSGSPTSYTVKWEGESDSYEVSCSMIVANITEWTTVTVSGADKYVFKDLLPGTQYRFRVQSGEAYAETVGTTLKAEPYSNIAADFDWTGSNTMYCFDNKRDIFLDMEIPSYDYYQQIKCKPVKERIVTRNNPSILSSCILFVFPTFGIPETMLDQPYTLLLHFEDYGTLVREGKWNDLSVCSNSDYIYVLLYDLFDEAIDTWSKLENVPFTVEVLIDQALVVSAEGKLE